MTEHATPIMASMRRVDETVGAIRIEDVFDTEVHDLWAALTVPSRLERWLATVDGELRAGGLIDIWFRSDSGGRARIDVCDAPHRLLVTVLPGEPEESPIEALLTADGLRTRLVIEQRRLPVAEVAAHGAGWQAHVEDLAAHLSGQEPEAWRPRWMELVPAYERVYR